VTRDERLLCVQMSNCLYALAQRAGHTYSEHEKDVFRELYQRWDAMRSEPSQAEERAEAMSGEISARMRAQHLATTIRDVQSGFQALLDSNAYLSGDARNAYTDSIADLRDDFVQALHDARAARKNLDKAREQAEEIKRAAFKP